MACQNCGIKGIPKETGNFSRFQTSQGRYKVTPEGNLEINKLLILYEEIERDP
jgi:hypothetical protein